MDRVYQDLLILEEDYLKCIDPKKRKIGYNSLLL